MKKLRKTLKILGIVGALIIGGFFLGLGVLIVESLIVNGGTFPTDSDGNKTSTESAPAPEDVKKEKNVLDVEKSAVECIDRKKYSGKEIIEKGFVFKVISGMISYKAEELERLCNPKLKEFNDDMELSFAIIPAYEGEIDYSKYDGDWTVEERENSKNGYDDGFVDGNNLKRKLKQGYIEPEGVQDHLKNLYYYGYFGGFVDGCKKIKRECTEAQSKLDEIRNTSSYSNDPTFVEPGSGNEDEIITMGEIWKVLKSV